MTQIHQDNSEMNALFIHSAIDDAGLSVHEFRIVCHLARRTGKGEAFPSAESMSKVCRMKRDTVFSALKVLAERNIVTLKRRKGQSSIYTINKPSTWKEPVPRNGATPKRGASPETGLHQSPETGLPPAPNGGTLRIYPEGNTHKEIPFRDNNPFKVEDEPKKPKPKPKQPRKQSTRGTRIPEGFPDQQAMDYAFQVADRDRAILEADKFRDHWLSVSGSRGVKADWLATWRNWLRKSEEYGKPLKRENQKKGTPNDPGYYDDVSGF